VTIDAGHDPGTARLLVTLLDADDVVARLIEPTGHGPYPGLENFRLLVSSRHEHQARLMIDSMRPAPRPPRPAVRLLAAVALLLIAGPLVLSTVYLLV